MCETFYFKIKRFPDRSKIALKGQFYDRCRCGNKNSSEQPQYYCPGELVAI